MVCEESRWLFFGEESRWLGREDMLGLGGDDIIEKEKRCSGKEKMIGRRGDCMVGMEKGWLIGRMNAERGR